MTQFLKPKYKLVIREPRVVSDGIGTSSEAFIEFAQDTPKWLLKNIALGCENGWLKLKIAGVELNDK
jgi:hypothetical protein